MPATFLAADTHLGHRLMGRTRPFASLEEHDETIIANWNKVVGPKDLVYHLGDVVMNRNKLHLVGRLNGRKKLILGNHDVFRTEEYLEHFASVASYKIFDWAILSHIPVHPDQLRRFGFNIHGHSHAHRVLIDTYTADMMGKVNVPDPRYFCVSMEQIDYTPVSLDVVKEKLNA